MMKWVNKGKEVDGKESDEIAFACDTDHDRHEIVTLAAGLLPPNANLAVAVHYLFSIKKKSG